MTGKLLRAEGSAFDPKGTFALVVIREFYHDLTSAPGRQAEKTRLGVLNTVRRPRGAAAALAHTAMALS